ncbi:hypothetical protein BBJ28_00005001 [Nothophytophthora sp. Chile5]|nr:hypothetical protein BBJ28_00005001 [Nothophytophthora sp. Chile5]
MLSSAKSMGAERDLEAERLEILRDPKRMASLLVRAFSSTSMLTPSRSALLLGEMATGEGQTRGEEDDEEVEETHEELQDEKARRESAGDDGCPDGKTPLRVIVTSAAADDDDDADEEDEEEDEEDDDDADAALSDRPLDEEELEAAATALQTATRIVEELRLKMLLKAGQQMERQQQQDDENEPPFSSAGSKALDRYFDAMDLTKTRSQQHAVQCASTGEISIGEQQLPLPSFSAMSTPTPSSCDPTPPSVVQPESSLASPPTVPGDENEETGEDMGEAGDTDDLDTTSSSTVPVSRRRHRHASISSTTTSTPTATKNRPWFSGHLRAMHVGDRLPRKKKPKGEGETDADANSPELRSFSTSSRRDRFGSTISVSSNSENVYEGGLDDVQDPDGQAAEDKAVDADGAITTADALAMAGGSRGEAAWAANVSNALSSANAVESKETHHHVRKKTRRTKFSRSASFDLTNLHSVAASPESSSSGSPSMKTFGLASAKNGTANLGSSGGVEGKSLRTKKAFDDSDIVDARSKPDSAEGKLKSEAELPAAVLRFAVYEMGAKENLGLRRTLGFAKANPVLDRYTLELDCRQRIVRAKSVFMHRFWSFHCDSVQSFVFGSSEGMARLIVFNGGQGNQSLELKFANDEEREQFKQAMDSCRSMNLDRIRGFASRAALSLPARPALPVSPVPDGVRSPTLEGFSGNISGEPSDDSAFGLNHDTGGSDLHVAESPILQPIHLPLLPGEVVVKDTELPATLLIGPASETYESTLVWGRLRGKIAVTNYRVLFLPFDRVQLQLRSNGQGGLAYIPLFAITQVQLLYPGGRRTKSGRTYYAGMAGSASIISISCKDIRVLRFQLDTAPTLSDDRTQKLRSTIVKMADAAQRYSTVERGSPTTTISPGLGPLPSTTGGGDTPPDADESDVTLQESQEPAFLSIHLTSNHPRSPFGPISFASPVLRPDRISTIPRELSGCFAFSYSMDIPSDKNGWNLFVDEREFKRQIGGDPAVSPFLKLLLPASMNSATLVKVADFRAKNRLPVITYYHRRNRCVLTRSSQPLLGNLLSGSSNLSDQLLVGVYRRLPDIIKNQAQSSASSRPIYIFDARKPKASTGNRLMGKGGVETPQDYPQAVIHHLNIANMYRMQSSFVGLMKLFLPGGIEDTDRTWLSSVESTRWLDHVRLVLEGALKIARVLELEGASVLVHCSDGWDRTAQLCALAQLMIDPYYRTIRGFAVLVEKDWCAFGHKFSERTGGDRNRDAQRSKSSPIMFQFIDAVWQIQRQYPYSFEFNERFLLHLANSMTSGLYGTFLYDSRLQRNVNEVEINSVSVWTPVLMTPSLYTNSNYELHNGPIWPWASCKMVRLWDNYFFQWHPKFYNCQWVCSLIHHGPSRARGSLDGVDSDSVNGNDHLQQAQSRVRDPPTLDLQATPITHAISEDDDENDVPDMVLSSEEGSGPTSHRVRISSGTFSRTQQTPTLAATQKSSKRNFFRSK